jgi:hypothetical protein
MKAIFTTVLLSVLLASCSQADKKFPQNQLMSSPMSLSQVGNSSSEISIEEQRQIIDRNFNGCKAHE